MPPSARTIFAMAWLMLVSPLAAQTMPPLGAQTGPPKLRAPDAMDVAPSPSGPSSSAPSPSGVNPSDHNPSAFNPPPPQPFPSRPSAGPVPLENGPRAAPRDPSVKPATFNEKVMTLAPPGKNKSSGDKSGLTLGGLFSVAASLLLVLGLFFLVMWMFRRGMPKGAAQLPGDVLEVVGRAPLAGRQQMHLIRLGNKLLLVSASPGGMETLSEVTDPLEVERLLGLCKQSQPNSVTNTFRNLLHQFSGEPTDDVRKDSRAAKRGRVEPLDEEVGDA